MFADSCVMKVSTAVLACFQQAGFKRSRCLFSWPFVSSRGIFFNNSRWYRAKIVPIFVFVSSLKSYWHKIIIIRHLYRFLRICFFFLELYHFVGTRCWWRNWLIHCATSPKVAGSIPDGVTGFFSLHNPSGRNMALGSTQPLTEMSTRNISWG
jgi:hypothetical protein